MLGRNTPQVQAIEDLFNDLKKTSFDYCWLEELRDALQHGDINAFKYDFTARLHGEPAVNVYMDREYMLQFTKQTTPQPGLCPAAVALRAASITRADGFLG